VAWAERIIAAHAAALAEGKGIVVVDGKLIENLHVLNAGAWSISLPPSPPSKARRDERGSKTNPGRFFEDFRLGETIPHATPRSLGPASAPSISR
jgi:Citrate lyase beta subunit